MVFCQPLNMAFKMADEVLMRSIKGLVDIVTRPGLVNLDFNDLKTIMKGGGVAMIGMGESDSVRGDRATEAIEEALNSPFLQVDVSEATGVIVNVVGGRDMTINEAEKDNVIDNYSHVYTYEGIAYYAYP